MDSKSVIHILLPFYHTVSDKTLLHTEHLYKPRTEKQFIADLDFLLSRYEPISIDHLYDLIRLKKVPHKSVFHLSFDDGLQECATLIKPILMQKGVPATFFINPAFVDNKAFFHRYKASILVSAMKEIKNNEKQKKIREILMENKLPGNNIIRKVLHIKYTNQNLLDELARVIGLDFDAYLKEKTPYMSKSQIRGLMKEGFTVGAHSLDHPEFYVMKEQEILFQVTESIKQVYTLFSQRLRMFSFPFTDHKISKDILQKIHSHMEYAPHLSFGTAGLKKDTFPLHLQRIPVENYNVPLRWIMRYQFTRFHIQNMFNKGTINR